MHLASPDWLFHRLQVTGEGAELRRFQDAVAGPGFLPWDIDYGRLEEDWYYRMMINQQAQPHRHRLSPAAARRLAGRLREAVWLLHDSSPPPPVPLDLHAVLPVPGAMLARGVEDAQAIGWLWQHWGTTWPLRHVRRCVTTDPQGVSTAAWACEFFSADWTPWPALAVLRGQFPALTLTVKVSY